MNKKQTVLIAIPFVAFVFSLACWFFFKPEKRFVFLMESFDSGKICIEERFFPSLEKNEQIKLFAEELVLGAQSPRYRSVFPHGTCILFCFFRDKTLFINFSGDIINSDSSSSELNAGFVLFRRNILHNFKYIKDIKMFADGNEISESI